MEKTIEAAKKLFLEELNNLRERNNIPTEFLKMLNDAETKIGNQVKDDYDASMMETMKMFQEEFSVSEECAAKICAISEELSEVCCDFSVAPISLRMPLIEYMDAISGEAAEMLDEISENLDEEDKVAVRKMFVMHSLFNSQASRTISLANSMLVTLLDLRRGKEGINVIKENADVFDFDDDDDDDDDDWCEGCDDPCKDCEDKPESCESCPCFGCEGCDGDCGRIEECNEDDDDEEDDLCSRCEGCPGEEGLKVDEPEILGDECQGCYGCNGNGDHRGYAPGCGYDDDDDWEDMDTPEDDIVRDGQCASYTTCVLANKKPKFDVELRIIPHAGYCLEVSECDSIVKSILGQAAEKFDEKLLRTQ